MPSSCCVPGCKSNYSRDSPNVSVFKFPNDDVCKQKWISSIHRAGFIPNNRSVVCIEHFDERFIVREDTFTKPDGTVITIKRDRLKLTNDAYPTRFKNLPGYLSKEVPKPRKHPDKRRDEVEKRVQEQKEAEEIEDTISDFNSLSRSWEFKFKCSNDVFIKRDDKFILVFKNQHLNNKSVKPPKIGVSLLIDQDLKFNVFKNETLIVDSPTVKGICNTGIVDKWSKLNNLCSFLFDTEEEFETSVQDNLETINSLIDDIKIKVADEKVVDKLEFCKEQLKLALNKPKSYCATFLTWFAAIYFSFPGAYKKIRQSNFLTMPHPTYLQTFTSKMGMGKSGIDRSHWQYLEKKVSVLNEDERLCNLMLDEVYVKPELTYRGGKLEGVAMNTKECDDGITLATTIQTFMISGVLNKNKDVVGLFPCKNLTSDFLCDLVLQVLEMLTRIGYRVLTIISDNNSVNGVMFEMLCKQKLKSSFQNPFDNTQTIFLLFDTVHLFKCIRNNWLNQTDSNQTFVFPHFNEPTSEEKMFASVSHLKVLYMEEENNVVKLAPALSKKVLYPTSLERQNVNLCCRIFDEKNIAALKEKYNSKKSDYLNGTIMFLEIILTWWKIVNVKHAFKGDRFNDRDRDAIFSLDSESFNFLKQFVTWLEQWKNITVQGESSKKKISHGKLTDQTHKALTHTVKTLIEIVIFLKNNLRFHYILLGKFQTDDLEARFGQYRQMSGSCYSISVVQVLQSERKLKALSVISAHSSLYDNIPLSDLSMCDELSKSYEEAEFTSDVTEDHMFENLSLEIHEVNISENEMLGLAYIGGYICKTVCKYISCEGCYKLLISSCSLGLDSSTIPKDNNYYFNVIDRGCLQYPSDEVLNLLIFSFKIFTVLISSRYEKDFLKSYSQRKMFIETVNSSLDDCNVQFISCCQVCSTRFDVYVKKCLMIFSNILLNNYRKKITSEEEKKKANKNNSKSKECITKKRKIEKLCA